MPKLKFPFDLSDPTAPRDVTPDTLGPLFNLVEWDEWRDGIEPYLDGKQHTYIIAAHFDRPESVYGEVMRFVTGPTRTIYFYSDAKDWTEWKRDYYTALRKAIDGERRRLTGMKLFLQGKLKRK